MSRIPTPSTFSDAPAESWPLLETVNAQFRLVPNMHRLISTSPHALEGHLGMIVALGNGALPPLTRE